ncbi:MAG: PaaI family thioesterase [Thermoplasmatota archaeon]
MPRIPLVPIPEGQESFVGGTKHPRALGIQFFLETDDANHATDKVVCEWVATEAVQGWPGLAHGSAFAALHDDACAWAMIALAGQTGFTTRLDIRFLRPIRLGEKLRVVGKVAEVDAKRGSFTSEISLADGTVASSARGEFAFVDGPMLERLLGRPMSEEMRIWLATPLAERPALVRARSGAR